MKKVIIILFMLNTSIIVSQNVTQISFSLMNENIHYKIKNLNNMNPGAEFGITLKNRSKKLFFSNINLYLGGFYHKKVESSIFLRGEYMYGIKLQDILSFDLHGSLGYMHSFYPGHLYEQNDSGNFEKINQTGRPHAIANIGLGFSLIKGDKIKPFIKWEIMGEAPFANGIPFIPHTFLKFGFVYNFKTNKNES